MHRGFLAALCVSVAAALLAGCGAPQSQPVIGSTAASPTIGLSRTFPGTSGNALLYAVNAGSILMLTYPGGQVYGNIKKYRGLNLCSDLGNGNVFVPSGNEIFEYAHGEKSPIATLTLSDNYDLGGCSVNPATGDLAVANVSNNGTNLLIFQGGSGAPQLYSDPNFKYFLYCGYDNVGNLFANGYGSSGHPMLTELPAGSGTFVDINAGNIGGAGTIQWDGRHITVEDTAPPTIYALAITGSTATVVGTTKLRNQTKGKNVPRALTYIYSGTVIAPEGKGNKRIGYWNYPQGGKPTAVINNLLSGKNHFLSFTISP